MGRVRREVDELVRDWFVVRFMERGTDSQDLERDLERPGGGLERPGEEAVCNPWSDLVRCWRPST